MTDESIVGRVDRLESLVERQQHQIERQRERLAVQRDTIETQHERLAAVSEEVAGQEDDGDVLLDRRTVLQAGGILGLLGVGAGAASADPQGSVGTGSDPLTALYTEEVNGVSQIRSNDSITVDVDADGSGTAAVFSVRTDSGSGSPTSLLTVDEGGRIDVDTGALDLNGHGAKHVASIGNDGSAIRVDDTLDVDGNDLVDGGTAVWDASAAHVPQGVLEQDSVEVAGNQVSLGESTSVEHGDLDAIEGDDHHTRPSAGDGLREDSDTFHVEVGDFAGTFLSDDGSGELTIDTGEGLDGDGSGNLRLDNGVTGEESPYEIQVDGTDGDGVINFKTE